MLALLLISVVTSLPRRFSLPLNPLALPPFSSATTFNGGLQPPNLLAPAPPCLLFCHFSARRPPTLRTTGKERPDYLREIDLSARATLYTVHGTNISAPDDISPSFSSSGLDVTVRQRPALSKDGQLCRVPNIFSFLAAAS